jgi:Icc-related predicted phosphoesterase
VDVHHLNEWPAAMRLLLFSDLHADLDQARALVERSRDFDLVIGAGDFGNLRRQLREPIEILSQITCPAVLVAGNNESTEELRDACHAWPTAHVLHGSGVTLQGVEFWGIGGGIPVTPFGDWSYDFSEDEADQLLSGCPRNAVLVSHSPPKGILDLSSQGKSLGSEAVRRAIKAKALQLVVCGHIHASGGRSVLVEKTHVVNAGPAGIEWSLPTR